MKLVRVVAKHFVAGFESDGIVRNAAPILRKALLGRSDDEARRIIGAKGWRASIVSEVQHEPTAGD